MTVDQTLDIMYRAAVNIQAPDIGDRSELEAAVNNGEMESSKIVEFFNEFGRLYAESLELEAAIARQAEADAVFNEALKAAHDAA